MLDSKDINSIQKLLNNKKIIKSKLLSNSFGINCFKLHVSNNEEYIIKFYREKNKNFNAIKSEVDNLNFLNSFGLNLFPKVYSNSDDYLIMSFIENDGIQPLKTNEDLLNAIISIHKCSSENYGFNFDTQIGGLRQKNIWSNNWVEFYRENRLGYIFELINLSYPMNYLINKKIEYLLKNLENFIPKNPNISLLHGDLWEGNILFKNLNFSGFIDPGSFYGHNEMEIAYLRWFNPKFIDKNFIEKYNDKIKIEKNYLEYEFIYQLYYSLLNVYLWERSYIKDVSRLLNKLRL